MVCVFSPSIETNAASCGEVNLQSKQDLICHVAKVKVATSAHSMADVTFFNSVFNIPFESNNSLKLNKIHFSHSKENNISNIFCVFMFQQLLASKHHRLCDSKS